jgi:hypothetical protein
MSRIPPHGVCALSHMIIIFESKCRVKHPASIEPPLFGVLERVYFTVMVYTL